MIDDDDKNWRGHGEHANKIHQEAIERNRETQAQADPVGYFQKRIDELKKKIAPLIGGTGVNVTGNAQQGCAINVDLTSSDIQNLINNILNSILPNGNNVGDLLQWNGVSWQPADLNSQNGDMLYYYGGTWIAFPAASLDDGNTYVLTMKNGVPAWVQTTTC